MSMGLYYRSFAGYDSAGVTDMDSSPKASVSGELSELGSSTRRNHSGRRKPHCLSSADYQYERSRESEPNSKNGGACALYTYASV